MIDAKGYIYFGTYTFLIIEALLLIDLQAALVPEEKKLYNSLPEST